MLKKKKFKNQKLNKTILLILILNLNSSFLIQTLPFLLAQGTEATTQTISQSPLIWA